MTETTTETVEAPQKAEEQQQNGNSEAAKYRRQLREAEAERDTLRSRVESLQRSDVERIASTKIEKASAVWAAGSQLADLLDEDGNVDPEKVAAAAESARDSLGLKHVPDPGVIPNQGTTPQSVAPEAMSWAAALDPHAHDNVD
ncbi:hypothetical protein C5B93_15905 [Rathayibacter sp. AY1A2]|uniref:hypothetical protein n=1 Tax=Rathayibacter sp. AY1A2 TaxID=2080520 RepID=UPI000CE808B9|nr:hypothetical protein [Rathayibacter sp. AY1A2]PPF32277.1 hypothetical protein C5B93_15905 [Rathayibacter sp. AY1A2]